jgi:hypothetical protein
MNTYTNPYAKDDAILTVSDLGLRDDIPSRLNWEKLIVLITERLFFEEHEEAEAFLFESSQKLLNSFNKNNGLILEVMEVSDDTRIVIRWQPDGEIAIAY